MTISVTWGGIKITRNSRHHRPMTGLRDFVFPRKNLWLKSRYVAPHWLVFLLPWSTTHGKCARFHPNHFRADGGVKVTRMVLADGS